MSFSSLGLTPELLRAVADLGFTQPTPIQEQSIPPGLEGRDVLGCAMTGSGKTAAFLLPILQRLQDKPRGTTRALIIAPTRELAAQIAESFEQLAKHTRMTGAAIYGGVSMGPQETAIRRGVDVLIATPGRLLDHLGRGELTFSELEVLVLDEADRMLDMGFLPDIRRVLQQLPHARQTMLFSATIPPPIAELTHELLKNPVRIGTERRSEPATGVVQAVYPVPEGIKRGLLVELLRRGEIGNALVFTRTKHRANRLAAYLQRHGVSCERIHGNRSQKQRTEALASFKNGDLKVLVATDIAARGIDVEALSHVVNFDVPNVPEDYVHRVGRTARAAATGDAFTFVSPEDEGNLRAIERAVGQKLPRRRLEGFDYSVKEDEPLEIPLQQRIAEIRSRRADERARARANAERKAQRQSEEAARQQQRAARPAQGGGRQQGGGQGRGQQPGQGRAEGQGRPSQPGQGRPSQPGQGGRRRDDNQGQRRQGGDQRRSDGNVAASNAPQRRRGGGGQRRPTEAPYYPSDWVRRPGEALSSTFDDEQPPIRPDSPYAPHERPGQRATTSNQRPRRPVRAARTNWGG